MFQQLTAFFISWHTPCKLLFPFLWGFYEAFFVLSSVGPEECALFSSSQVCACLLIFHLHTFSNIVAKVHCVFFNHTTCGQTAYHSNLYMLPRHDKERFSLSNSAKRTIKVFLASQDALEVMGVTVKTSLKKFLMMVKTYLKSFSWWWRHQTWWSSHFVSYLVIKSTFWNVL